MIELKQKGFTLAELLGVVVLLGVLAIVAVPPILNQLNNSKNKLSDAMLKIFSVATEGFVDEHGTQYPIKAGNVYCIKLKTLVEYGKLDSPILDASTGETIDEETKTIKMTINGFNDYSYELVNTGECSEVKTEDTNS